MVRDGWLYGAGFGAGTLVSALVLDSRIGVATCVVCAAFCLFFFRDPDRVIPSGRVCVAPADGKVVQLRNEPDGRTRISIFLSIFDVHVNRSPVAGRVQSVRYHPGRYRIANRAVASTENERNTLVVADRDGGALVELTQIAGLIARRIVCWKRGRRRGREGRASRTDQVRIAHRRRARPRVGSRGEAWRQGSRRQFRGSLAASEGFAVAPSQTET